MKCRMPLATASSGAQRVTLGLNGTSGLLAETIKPFLSNVFILLPETAVKLELRRDFRKSRGPMEETNLVPRCSF